MLLPRVEGPQNSVQTLRQSLLLLRGRAGRQRTGCPRDHPSIRRIVRQILRQRKSFLYLNLIYAVPCSCLLSMQVFFSDLVSLRTAVKYGF